MKATALHTILCLACLLAMPFASQAQQERNTLVLPLDSCTALALRNQTKAVNARLDVEAARHARLAARTKYFPSLSLSAGWFRSMDYLIDVHSSDTGNAHIDISGSFDGQSYDERIDHMQAELDRLGIDLDIRDQLQHFGDRFNFDAHLQMLDRGYYANAMLMQPLFAGGRIVNGNRLAQLALDAALLQQEVTENAALLQTARLYWQVVSLTEKRKTLLSYRQTVDTLAQEAQAGVDAGVISRNDLLKVRLKQKELLSASLQLDNGITMTTMALCQYIGLPYSDSVDYLFDTLSLPGEENTLLMRDPVAAAAERNESRLLEMAEEAALLQRKMTIGEALPQVAIGATYGVSNITGSATSNGIVFATASIPLSAWWETSHMAQRQKIEWQKAANNRADLQQQMELQTRQLWNEICEARIQVEIQRQAVSDAEENLAESRNYYQAGMSSLSEYLEAQSLLQQARNNLTDQIIVYRLKIMEYNQLTDNR